MYLLDFGLAGQYFDALQDRRVLLSVAIFPILKPFSIVVVGLAGWQGIAVLGSAVLCSSLGGGGILRPSLVQISRKLYKVAYKYGVPVRYNLQAYGPTSTSTGNNTEKAKRMMTHTSTTPKLCTTRIII